MGNHSYSVLLKLLDKFIVKYVLCKQCNLPELNRLIIGKKLKSSCKACPY